MSMSSFVPKELESPVRSARLLALQKAFFEGNSEEVLTALELRDLLEDDDECRLLLKQAIQAVRRRLGKVVAELQPAFDPAALHHRYQAAGSADRLLLLEDLDSRQRSALASRALDWFTHEREPALQAALIRMFGEFWPAGRLDLIVARIHDPSLSVRLAALGVLVKRAPHLIAADLEALAGADDPGVRALAIRGLFALEPSRGLASLSGMLLSPDPAQRRTALNVCLALPFEQVKPLVLQFIALESDTELILHAGRSFQLNPDVDSPYRLWEIAEESSPAKSAVVRRVLQGVCEAISTSNLLGEERKFHEYYQQLQEWIYRKAAGRFVQDCINRLTQEEEGGETPELAAAVRKHMRFAPVRAAFEEALGWPLAEPLRDRLRGWLRETADPATEGADPSLSPPPPSPTGPAAEPPPGSGEPTGSAQKSVTSRPGDPAPSGSTPGPIPTAIPEEESAPAHLAATSPEPEEGTPSSTPHDASRGGPGDSRPTPPGKSPPGPPLGQGAPAPTPPPAREAHPAASGREPENALFAQVAGWDRRDLPQARPVLQKALDDPALSDRARILLIRTALRLGARDFAGAARGWLKHSNEAVVAAAIEYLAFADPDGLFALIGQFFRNPAQRVVSAAIKALRQADQAQAVSYLSAMLRDRQPTVQKMALGCLVYVDFALIREPLAAFMAGTRSRELLEAALCLFLANPEPENLPLLDEVSRALPAELGTLLREVRRKTETLLARFGRVASPEAGQAVSQNPVTATPATASPPIAAALPGSSASPPKTAPARQPAATPAAQTGAVRPRSPPLGVTPAASRPPSSRAPSHHAGPEKNRHPRAAPTAEPSSGWWTTSQTWVAAGGVILVGSFFSLISSFLSPLGERPAPSPGSGESAIRKAPATDNASGPLTTSADLFEEYRRLKRRGKTP